MVGLVPVVGEVADVANGIWYLAEGNKVDAALSMSSAIPLFGYGATAVKAVRWGDRILDAADTANDARRAVDTTNDARRAVDTANDGRRAVDDVPTPGRTVDGPPAPTRADTPTRTQPPTRDAPSRAPSCNSFVPGTRVVLADGTTKDIEDLRVGDTVSADDVESGDTQPRTVTAVHRHAGTKKLVTLTVDTDGAAGDQTATVTSTAAHPYWLPDVGRWVTADKLRPGMWLQTAAGTWVQVTAVKQQTRHQQVHNLTVNGLHTYYVLAGNTPVLVHNTNCDPFDELESLRSQQGAAVSARLDIGDQKFRGWNDKTRQGSIPGRWSFFLQHAEGHTFVQALTAGVQGGHARLYVLGKDPCRFCQSDIAGMARMLGLDSLKVITPQGLMGVFTRESGRMKWNWR